MGGLYIDICGRIHRPMTPTGAPGRTDEARFWPDKLVPSVPATFCTLRQMAARSYSRFAYGRSAERPFAYRQSPRNPIGSRPSTSFGSHGASLNRHAAQGQRQRRKPLAWCSSAEPNRRTGWSRDHP
eukprot:2269203-Prymnesium_polylepis.1